MEVRLDDPKDPQSYKIVALSDQLKVDYDNFTNLASAADANCAIPPVLDRNQLIQLGPPEAADLAVAIDTLVDWSITSVESKTTAIQRRVSGDDYNRYIFQGLQGANEVVYQPVLSLG